jgi:YbbR domain-containing protein
MKLVFKGIDLKLALISVLFAICLWLYIGEDISLRKSFSAPVRCINIPDDIQVVMLRPRMVSIRVEGKKHYIMGRKGSDFFVPIDLKTAEPGEYEYRITPKRVEAPEGINVISVSPPKVRAKLIRKKWIESVIKAFYVKVECANLSPDLGVVNINPTIITVEAEGKKEIIESSRSMDFLVVVDMKEAEVGQKRYPIYMENVEAPRGLRVIDINPKEVRVTLERRER